MSSYVHILYWNVSKKYIIPKFFPQYYLFEAIHRTDQLRYISRWQFPIQIFLFLLQRWRAQWRLIPGSWERFSGSGRGSGHDPRRKFVGVKQRDWQSSITSKNRRSTGAIFPRRTNGRADKGVEMQSMPDASSRCIGRLTKDWPVSPP